MIDGEQIARDARLIERRRIAQELHDTLLQGFLSVSMQLHEAVDQFPEDSASGKRLSHALELFDRVLEQGRYAVQGLRSPDARMQFAAWPLWLRVNTEKVVRKDSEQR